MGIVRRVPPPEVAVLFDDLTSKFEALREAFERQLGVPEYWLVDGDARIVERLVLREGRYAIVAALADDEVFRPTSFDGLEIPLSTLWTS